MHPVLIDFSFLNIGWIFTWFFDLLGREPPGAFKLHTYGLMIAIGFLVGTQLGAREARRVDLDGKGRFDQFILDLTFWILLVSMAGARLLFIIVEWDTVYSRDPLKMFKIWEGGFVFYGGFLAALIFSVAYSRAHGRNFFLVADTLIPSVALGHFFGRLGCVAAGCCWGVEVDPDFPLAIQYPAGAQAHASMVGAGVIGHSAAFTPHVHPVQLYEAFGELSLFFILIFTRTIKRFHGQVLLTYLFLYPILRTSLEFIRGDKARGEYLIFGAKVSTSQIISILVATAAVTLLVTLVRRRKAAAAPTAQTAPA
ncbi:MAG: prolipoprotein diacylglyceryl transferase [Myxococcota bacterium]